MNSFSTVFKRRAITLSIAILCAIIGAIGNARSVHKDDVAARYAKRVPVAAKRLQIKGVENAGKISAFCCIEAHNRAAKDTRKDIDCCRFAKFKTSETRWRRNARASKG